MKKIKNKKISIIFLLFIFFNHFLSSQSEKKFQQLISDAKNVAANHKDSAFRLLKDAYAIYPSIKSDSLKIDYYLAKGLVELQNVIYDQSLNSYFTALELSQKSKDYRRQVVSNNQIGKLYLRQSENKLAKDYFINALEIARTNNFKNKISDLCNNLGYTTILLGNLDDGEKYHLEALQLRKELNDTNGISVSYSNLGFLEYKRGNLNQCKNYFYKSLENRKSQSDKRSIAQAAADCADIEVELNNYNQALVLLSYAESFEVKDKDFKLSTLKRKYKVYEKMKDYEKAFDFQKKYYQLHDSIYTHESKENIVKLENKFQLQNKENEIELLKKDNQIQNEQNEKGKIFIFSMILISILLVLVLFATFKQIRNKKIANNILEKKNAIIEEKQKEIMDSFNYAKKIQDAILPSEKYIEQSIKK